MFAIIDISTRNLESGCYGHAFNCGCFPHTFRGLVDAYKSAVQMSRDLNGQDSLFEMEIVSVKKQPEFALEIKCISVDVNGAKEYICAPEPMQALNVETSLYELAVSIAKKELGIS